MSNEIARSVYLKKIAEGEGWSGAVYRGSRHNRGDRAIRYSDRSRPWLLCPSAAPGIDKCGGTGGSSGLARYQRGSELCDVLQLRHGRQERLSADNQRAGDTHLPVPEHPGVDGHCVRHLYRLHQRELQRRAGNPDSEGSLVVRRDVRSFQLQHYNRGYGVQERRFKYPVEHCHPPRHHGVDG